MHPTERAAVLPDSTSTNPSSQPAEAKRPGPLRKAGGLVGGMVVGGALGFFGMKLLGPDVGDATRDALRAQLGPWVAVVAALLTLLAIFVGIAVHELGHVLGGRVAGFRFWLFVTGPLRIERDEATDRVVVGLNREASLYGGVASSLPTDTHNLIRRFALMVAGGPAASVALALLAYLPLGLGVRLPALVGFGLGILAALSAVLAVATLVPMRTGGFNSDGARLLRLARGGPAGAREAATLSLIGLMTAGTRPREWPRDLVEAAMSMRDGTLEECFAVSLAYYHALDGGELERAGALKDRMVELKHTYPPALAPSIDVEGAYFEAAHRRDAARARAHLAAIPPKSFAVKPYDRAAAEAAIAFVEGDFARAREEARRALETLPARAAFRRDGVREILRAAGGAETTAGRV